MNIELRQQPNHFTFDNMHGIQTKSEEDKNVQKKKENKPEKLTSASNCVRRIMENDDNK